MGLYAFFSIVIVLAVTIHCLNHRLVKIQSTIAITLGAFVISLILVAIKHFSHIDVETPVATLLGKLDFKHLLLDGMLGFLLFGGALTLDVKTLIHYKWEVGILAIVGTLISTVLVAFFTYYLLQWLGMGLSLIDCLLFGAIISPTDPIAVLATLKSIGASKALSAKISGESLFNDGVGLVLFITLYHMAFGGITPTWMNVSILFLREAIGGIVYGLVIGFLASELIKRFNDKATAMLLTICIACPGYVFAQFIEISGPLAMVVAGLMVGYRLNRLPSPSHAEPLMIFWELVEELLNTILFLLIGLEILTFSLQPLWLVAGLIAIVLVLVVRLISVGLPMQAFKRQRAYAPFVVTILTWGGLRGALALAMALSLPAGTLRDMILTMTYCIVLFAIVVQGLTTKPLVNWSQRALRNPSE